MLTLTQLVERVISEISSEHREDFHTVRLNGFIHTDDKLALREIWRQLGIEMEVEDDLTGKVRLPQALEIMGLLANLLYRLAITQIYYHPCWPFYPIPLNYLRTLPTIQQSL